MSYKPEFLTKIRKAFMKGYPVAQKVGYVYQLDNDQVDYKLPGEKPLTTREIWYIQMPEQPEGMSRVAFREEHWRYRCAMQKMAGIPGDAICVEQEWEVTGMLMEAPHSSIQITDNTPFVQARRKAAA